MTRFLKAAEIGTGGAMTLPGRYYTDPDLFRQETERIFLREWICAGREERIPEPGDYFVRNLGTESVLVVRDTAGEIRAFHNVCRHRGARLCTEEGGRFSRHIRCPYHAWAYALDGCLVGAASMKDAPGFDLADYPLLPVSVARWEGFLFLSLSDSPEPFEQTHAPLIGRFARYRMPTLQMARRIVYDLIDDTRFCFGE
ncbi:MAG: Rieske (2Fe-2S) protein [Capsulimonadales bacterium]|nr:Rieske (2Fe-2S) protein [Capsulimonadales bacterium]